MEGISVKSFIASRSLENPTYQVEITQALDERFALIIDISSSIYAYFNFLFVALILNKTTGYAICFQTFFFFTMRIMLTRKL